MTRWLSIVFFLLMMRGNLGGHGVALADAPMAKDYSQAKLEDFKLKPVEAKKDEKTDFVVSGKNPTALVRAVASLNGRTIAELEADMRPDAMSDVGSTAGFIGKDEKLLDVLAADNQYVVDELGLTHQEIARHLHLLGAIGIEQQLNREAEAVFLYHGRRFSVKVQHTRGYQLSPFRDGTKNGSNATVRNLDTGKTIEFALLVPHMIERYGFYEGQGTPYRVDPKKVVETLDFLAKKPTRK